MRPSQEPGKVFSTLSIWCQRNLGALDTRKSLRQRSPQILLMHRKGDREQITPYRKDAEERGMKMSLPALIKISSFSDDTSSPRIFNICKCPVMSRWQSLSAWYSVISHCTFHSNWTVSESFPILHLAIFGTFTDKSFCYTIHMLQVLGFGGASSIRGRLSSRIVLQLIDRSAGDVFSVNIMSWILNYPPRKQRLRNNIIF